MYDLIKTLIDENKLTFNCNHNINAKYRFEQRPESLLKMIEDTLEFYPLRNTQSPVLRDAYCFNCGKYLNYSLVGDTLVPNKTDCFSAETASVDIPVPSGILMFDDWLEHASDLLGHLDSYRDDINCIQGQIERMKTYAAFGAAHFCVGNSSPHVFEKDHVLYIGDNSYDEEDNEVLLIEGSVDHGSVCTDLWWVTACDKQVYEEMAIQKHGEVKGKQIAKEAEENADVRLQVTPGTYRLTYTIHRDHSNQRLFASLSRSEE